MQLELGIALTCGPEGCLVRRLDGTAVETHFGSRVRDRIRVRAGDLVAVDVAPQPPHLVWRWWHGVVEGVDGARARVSRAVTQSSSADPPRSTREVDLDPRLHGQVQPGDTVYFSDAALIDVARSGLPANPERLRAERFPDIVAAYAGDAAS